MDEANATDERDLAEVMGDLAKPGELLENVKPYAGVQFGAEVLVTPDAIFVVPKSYHAGSFGWSEFTVEEVEAFVKGLDVLSKGRPMFRFDRTNGVVRGHAVKG